MSDRRFNAWPAAGTDRDRAVQVIRSYDGRIFAMSSHEARDLASMLTKAADQAEARRAASGQPVPGGIPGLTRAEVDAFHEAMKDPALDTGCEGCE